VQHGHCRANALPRQTRTEKHHRQEDAADFGWTGRLCDEEETNETRAARNAKSGANSGERLNATRAAPPNEKARGGEDQAGQSSADGGGGDRGWSGSDVCNPGFIVG
jgi:hypothetical protein